MTDKDDAVKAAEKLKKENYIASLQEERRGYEIRGMTERLAQVDKQLRKAGHRTDQDSHQVARSVPVTEKRPR